jgi:superoxide dismutase, Cu-Zn family
MRKSLVIAATSLALTIGCSSTSLTPAATATLEPRSGSNARGTATFMSRNDGAVSMRVDVTGVTPGAHGIHVHEKGDCSAPDASTAGGHFNPNKGPHGAHTEPARHAGDFGNVTAGANGEIHETVVVSGVNLGSDMNSIVGKAVVLHAKRDDLTSQPSGDSGDRIACGIVTLAGSMQ